MTEPVIAGRGFFARAATIGCMLGALALSGCTTDMDKGLCPSAFILAPVSTLTVFRVGAPEDPSGELYTVSMTNAKTSCDFDKKKIQTESEVRIMFHAKRAPSAEAAAYNVPYFLSVTRHGRDLSLAGVPLAVTHRHRGGFLCCVDFLPQTCHCHYPGGTTGFCRSVLPRQGQEAHSPAAAAFPISVVGRLPHRYFRGLLDIHFRYGLPVRGTAMQSFPSKAPTVSFPPPPLQLLPAEATKLPDGI